VNWMTAGKDVVHSERTPDYLRTVDKSLHGLQISIALPKNLEAMDPNFVHIDANDLPVWKEDNLCVMVIDGESEDKKSDVNVYSKLYMNEIKANKSHTVTVKHRSYGEGGLYILEGSIKHQNNQ